MTPSQHSSPALTVSGNTSDRIDVYPSKVVYTKITRHKSSTQVGVAGFVGLIALICGVIWVADPGNRGLGVVTLVAAVGGVGVMIALNAGTRWRTEDATKSRTSPIESVTGVISAVPTNPKKPQGRYRVTIGAASGQMQLSVKASDVGPLTATLDRFVTNANAQAAAERAAKTQAAQFAAQSQAEQAKSVAVAQIEALSKASTADALQQLHNLLYTHVITDEEFAAAKRRLLGLDT